MITKEKKQSIIKNFGKTPRDTGSGPTQIALLTERINDLMGYFKNNPKDHLSRQGLLKIVGQRRRLLSHLRQSDPKRYVKILKELNLRK